MRFTSLNDWLNWQETLNPAEIDLGLDRVAMVLAQAGYSSRFDCPLITVAGTNGKGSTVALLEAIAMAAGMNVCSYTSPHLKRYNERIKINGVEIDDNSLCDAFACIDNARGDVPLTYFEFGTLAAIELFFLQKPDLVILEVGLGGRLDAVNIMDADVSILSSVAIDHVDWLGDDREKIGYEKAGVFRPGKTAICTDVSPPQSVLDKAKKLQCEYLQLGRDFTIVDTGSAGRWMLQTPLGDFDDLPPPALAGEFQKANAASAILAMLKLFSENNEISRTGMAIDRHILSRALTTVILPGRFQQISHCPDVYVDIAHNPQAAQALVSQLLEVASLQGCRSELQTIEQDAEPSKTWAIVAMLKDKDCRAVLEAVSEAVDQWCLAGLEGVSRGMSVNDFVAAIPGVLGSGSSKRLSVEAVHDLQQNKCTILNDKVMLARSVSAACEAVIGRAGKADRLIIFGSFYTVAEAMQYFLQPDNTSSDRKSRETI